MEIIDKRTKINLIIILIIGAVFCLWMLLHKGSKLDKEMAIRNNLTEKIIDIYPIPDINISHSQHVNVFGGNGFKFEYRSVQDAISGYNVDSVYNIVLPEYGVWNAADRERAKEHITKRAAREKQLSVKSNPNYVADGVTAVLEFYPEGHSRIQNKLGYILVNDIEELEIIEDDIRNIRTIIVLMRYNANSNSYRTNGGKTSIVLNQEGMSVYFYDCRNGEVFDNFTILADDLPEKFTNYGSSTFVTAHVDTINSKLKINLTGQLSFDKILW